MPSLAGAVALGLQVVGEGPLANAEARRQAVVAGEAKVNAAIDTAVGRFEGRGGETVKAAEHTWQEVRSRCERNVVPAVEQGQPRPGSATERAVARHVVRERRCPDKRTPSRVGLCGGIAIGVAIANR